MAFSPMTTVLFLQGVPLDNQYTDTLSTKFLGSTLAQENYFRTKIIPGIPPQQNLTYQREERYVSVPIEKELLANCNYLMYQNANYSNKWYYAFVTQVQYKNENTSYVYFEIDNIQTYLFDLSVKQSFVEREHVTDDTKGANLIDEGLAIGDFVCSEVYEKIYEDWWIVAGHTIEPRSPYGVVSGKFYGNVFSGVRYYCYGTAASFGAMLDELESAGKLEGAITEVFMLPKDIVSPNQSDGQELQTNPEQVYQWNVPGFNDTTVDGYTPRNKKLLTYPYKFVNLSNMQGQQSTLRYEFMAYEAGQLRCMGSIMPYGKILCYPAGYRGMSSDTDSGIMLGNYPQCAWNTNVYANWNAQQQVITSMSMAGNLAVGGAQALIGNPIGAGASIGRAVNTAINDMQETIKHDFTPAQARGQAGGETLNITRKSYGFKAMAMSITADYAKSIDNFLTMFGYKVNKVKTPNMTTRPSFNYVKTVDSKVVGTCPVGAIETMKNALNNGITFWHGDFVGDYSRAN